MNGMTDNPNPKQPPLFKGELKLKSNSVQKPSIMNAKKSNRCLFSNANCKKKSNHEVKDLWQRSFRLHDVIYLLT